jgi:TonB family protein
MEPHPDPKNHRLQWLTSRKSIVLVAAFGLLVLVFQLNRLLSSSFRLEVFGVEILEVQKLDVPEHRASADAVPPHLMRRPAPRVPLPPPDPPRPEVPRPFVTEQTPELIGGLGALQRKVRYPELARRAGVEGRVILQFTVDEQGRVTDPRIIRGIGAGCDEEALRVVKQARFRPGTQRGKPVQVKMSLPITFRLAR